MQGNKQNYQTLQLDSPNKKNFNFPLSMNNFNSLTTPKFLVGTNKHSVVNIASPEFKNKNENEKNFSTINNNINHQNCIFNNAISSPQNNFSTIPNNTNTTFRKNESFNITNSLKNSIKSSSINKNNPSNKYSNSSVKNEVNRGSNTKGNQIMRNSETERNIFLNDRRVKNKKETNYINININIKDEKSDFKKIADLFDSKAKFYLSTRNRENNINKDSNRSNSIKNNNDLSKYKLNTKTDFFKNKNLPFSGNLSKKKNFSDTSSWISSPFRRLTKRKSNSISNYIELNNKTNDYQTDYNVDYHTISSSSKSKQALNFPFKNYCGNNMKSSKKFYMTKNSNEDSYTYLSRYNNFRPVNRNSSIDNNTISSDKKNSLFVNDFRSNINSNIKYKRFTNNYNNTINNNNDTKVNFSNTCNFHTYNPSMNSINSTINNPYAKNHFMILLSVIGEKINKAKRFFFKKILLFTENTERTNRKYALRLIIKMLKRRLICHKLNFFTRGKLFL